MKVNDLIEDAKEFFTTPLGEIVLWLLIIMVGATIIILLGPTLPKSEKDLIEPLNLPSLLHVTGVPSLLEEIEEEEGLTLDSFLCTYLYMWNYTNITYKNITCYKEKGDWGDCLCIHS